MKLIPDPKELLIEVMNAPHFITDFDNTESKFYPYSSQGDIDRAYMYLCEQLGGDHPLEKYYGDLIENTCCCYDINDTDRLWALIGKSLYPFADFSLEY